MKIPLGSKFNLDLSIGKVVRFFVFSDLILLSGWGLIQPIFAVFITQHVVGATLVTVGVSASIYWITRSVIQLPIAYSLDKIRGEKDDFYVLITSFFIAAASAFGMIFVHTSWQLYLVQFFEAVGFGMYVPSWTGIFSRHVDREHSSFAWSLDNTIVSVASGATGVVGGILAQTFGFSIVFFLAGVCTLFAALVIFTVPDYIFPRQTGRPPESVPLRDHTPRSGVR